MWESAKCLFTGGTAPYDYQWSGGQTGSKVSDLPKGEHKVTVVSDEGCEETATVTVEEEVAALRVSVNTVCDPFTPQEYLKEVVLLGVDGGIPIADATNVIDVNNEEIVPTEPGNKNVYHQYERCNFDETIFTEAWDNQGIYIPNAFSPNGDGENDEFQVYNYERSNIDIQTFRIFDRWGALVYEVTGTQILDNQHPWNGNYANGNEGAVGTYVYTLTYNLPNCADQQVKTHEGSILLIR